MKTAAIEVSPPPKEESKEDIKNNDELKRIKLSSLTLFNFQLLGFHQLNQVESASLTRIVLSAPTLGEITGNV